MPYLASGTSKVTSTFPVCFDVKEDIQLWESGSETKDGVYMKRAYVFLYPCTVYQIKRKGLEIDRNDRNRNDRKIV